LRRLALVFLVVLIVGISLQVAFVKRPPNYRVVTNAAQNILEGVNPYERQERLDYFKYSPLAGLLTAPFLLVPDTLGMFLFVSLQLGFFVWAFSKWTTSARLDRPPGYSVATVAFFSVVFDVTVAVQNCQVNVGVFALMLAAAAQFAEGKYIRAGLVLSLATNLKLFPFTLGLCLSTSFQKKYWLAFFGGLLLWAVLPTVFLGIDSNLRLHGEWLRLMTWDQTRDLSMLDVGSFLALHFGVDPSVRNVLAVAVGILIGVGVYRLFRGGRDGLVHRFVLPVNGLYVLLFSYLSESPTSVLAVAGIFLIGVEALNTRDRAPLYWGLWGVALMLIPIFYSDLVTKDWGEWARDFHLKTIGYFYVMVVLGLIFWRRYFQQGLTETNGATDA
jgi:hypothetical protein